MVFGLSVLNRVHNFMPSVLNKVLSCPKQGMVVQLWSVIIK